MIKGKELLGRPIVAIDNGERIDTVHDLIFDHQANQVLGLLVDEGGWFHSARVLPFEAVRSIGEDAVMVDSAASVTSTRDDGRLADLLNSKVSLLGMTLLTTDGQNLGKLADVFFDEYSGQVEGYEATGGIFSDLSSGRTFVPAPEHVQIGHDAAIVPISVASAMEEQEPGGIRGAVQSAGESISGAYQNIAESTKERQREYVVGKTAGGDITLEDGTVLIHKGETITEEHAQKADEAGKLTVLATAATGAVLSETYGSVKERVQGSYEDLRGATAERQREFVVGKTAARDVTAEVAPGVQEVIVHQGDAITEFHAARAEETGKLGELLASAGGGAISEGLQNLRENVSERVEAVRGPSIEDTLGRRVKTDVRSPAGGLVAAQGQIVTSALVERARQAHAEEQLIAATVGTPQGSPAAGTGAGLAGGVSSVSEGASNLLDKAKAWFHDKREEAGDAIDQRQEQLEEKRIRDALGRPVNRVILAPDDSIILNVGEIITHKAVNLARSGDVLDILLDSVSKETVDIDPLAVRPHETGIAALEGQPDLGPGAEVREDKPSSNLIVPDGTNPAR
ncbi:PRC-barrel domain-containing protein [Deinococcus hopiensis]|uniref:Uncharacterized protein YrrD, contains PRC-barrel domain n=1 Tax=Deinococcus hopiensis KR-140 TaxID=695939 RepID=A0A1W1VL94_9DEIO|nr:PRC-barrel domain-containing protein [Deinococcus hopiensis]SMB94127.1 Uncharacterized protein YrrD, contains PRC-barrel domain [Deinococcus hopiensis KR-140]